MTWTKYKYFQNIFGDCPKINNLLQHEILIVLFKINSLANTSSIDKLALFKEISKICRERLYKDSDYADFIFIVLWFYQI